MKSIFTSVAMLISFCMAAQDSMIIPKGVVYKRAGTAENNKARTLLQQEFNANTVTYSLFDGVVFIGPRLWNRYKDREAFSKIKGGNVQFNVPITDSVTQKESVKILNGKLVQNNDDFKILWNQIIADAGSTAPVIRKVKEKELSYYWAIINFDIEEPVYVAETSGYNLLVQFIGGKMIAYWLEEMPKN